LFDTTPPEGYEDITLPTDDSANAEIVAALRLYAELSGGHYPRVTTFDADALRTEMLKLVNYTGQPREDWKKLQQIEQATIGLNRIARILRNGVHAGYYGETVGSTDKDKVLLWWNVAKAGGAGPYCVFYGDLRTEILPLSEWAELVSPEVARNHLPDNE
jgi:hypothetical protein